MVDRNISNQRFEVKNSLRNLALIFLTIITALTTPVQAHEVTPSVSDLTINDGIVSLNIKLNIESFVAGIDLQSVENTDDTELANTYDSFRVTEPAELEQTFRAFWPKMTQAFSINSPESLTLTLEEVSVPEIGNESLPRESNIEISASLPANTPSVTITWPASYGALIIRQQGVDSPYTGYLETGGTSDSIPVRGGVKTTAWKSFLNYIPVGFDHIVPKGLDHILFVLGLFFLGSQFKTLIWQISIFTIAHTVTLVLGSLGWVSISASIVEPLIAVSIVYVALENLFTDKLHKWRSLLIFGFGLLHGLGFASVLGEFGLPTQQFIPALLGFNIGVELGQLAVVAIAYCLVGIWFRKHTKYRQYIAMPASVLIALVGAWWFLERTVL